MTGSGIHTDMKIRTFQEFTSAPVEEKAQAGTPEYAQFTARVNQIIDEYEAELKRKGANSFVSSLRSQMERLAAFLGGKKDEPETAKA